MKTIPSILASVILCGFSTVAYAGSFTIDDTWSNAGTFWGGEYDGQTWKTNRDIIGSVADFEVSSIVANTSSTQLSFKIYSQYFDNIGLQPLGFTSGIQLGDLFLSSTGWNPNTYGVHNQYDNYVNGETWEYALVLSDHTGSTTAGNLSLQRIDDIGTIVNSNSIHTAGDIRWGQEVQYKPGTTGALFNGSWAKGLDSGGDYLLMTIGGTGFDTLGLVDGFGLHWTMSCGNDVIEGMAPVPEPATMLLFGTGLAALTGLRLRRKK
jgi:hypothetical protein